MSRWDDIWNEKKKSHIYPLMTGAIGGVLAGGVLFGTAMKFAVPAGMVSPTAFHLVFSTGSSFKGFLAIYKKMK